MRNGKGTNRGHSGLGTVSTLYPHPQTNIGHADMTGLVVEVCGEWLLAQRWDTQGTELVLVLCVHDAASCPVSHFPFRAHL